MRGDRRVSPDLHVDPAALRATAAAVEALLPALHRPGLDPADLGALAALPGGSAVVVEHDRLTAAAARMLRELTEVAASLASVVAVVESADHAAVRALPVVDR